MATTAFQTPRKEQATAPRGAKLTETEKQQSLENLDIEGAPNEMKTLVQLSANVSLFTAVENEKRRFEAYLQDILQNFATRHEAQITRIPKDVRKMTLREFDRYGGTITACVQALCKQRIAAGEEMGLDRKRYVLLLVPYIVFDSFNV